MITLPNKPKIIEEKGNRAVFEVEACYPGYGVTLGNAMRRVLLSSLPGAAIVGVKIKGVQHEFSTIPHVAEDVVQIILNLKQIRFKLHTDQPAKVSLKVKGEKQVKAGDIKTGSEVEVINKDAYVATLTDRKAELEMEMEIEAGLGYLPIEARKKGKIEIGKIALDAIFSPVKKVTYSIENMRVGEKTDYNRIRFNIETDGTISPKQAFLKAAQTLVDHYQVFAFLGEEKKKKEKAKAVKVKEAKKPAKKEESAVNKTKLEDLKISVRTASALTGAGIKTIAGLVGKEEADLRKIEGLGDKGILEIKRALGKLGLILK
ncbi:MAG: DNA-directed RNA polymerase subunit alpha [Patescibacteria group bacterium]